MLQLEFIFKDLLNIKIFTLIILENASVKYLGFFSRERHVVNICDESPIQLIINCIFPPVGVFCRTNV